jgi:hypothetical protein
MNFKEQYLFAKYKDTSIGSAEKFRKQIKHIDGVNFYTVYINVVNYQIKKYGHSLDADFIPKVDTDKVSKQSRERKKYRLNKGMKKYDR